jgi:NAD(P)-dependent dehydrogenase (short-subunit alcohol dehydrogenase family)
MKQSHEGRVALVTGSARGIGRAIAIKLAERGARLVLVDLDEPTGTAAEIGGAALAIAADISEAAMWDRIGEAVERRFGRADIVVNNAGIGSGVGIEDLEFDVWRRTMAVNLDAHFLSAKQFVPGMRKNGWGRIVSICSNSIGVVVPGLSHYMASKMGAMGFVRGLANDVAAYGITVNAVLPALTNTQLVRDMPEEMKRQTWGQQAIKRFAEPEDIAGPVCFLTSDDAAFVTGQSIVVDGGQYKIS